MHFYIFTCFLIYSSEGLHVTTPLTLASKSAGTHNLYAKSAKLIHLANNILNDRPAQSSKRNNGGRMSDTDELMINLLQILQKKYDSNRIYNGFVDIPMVRVHYISNPDVLEKFRNKNLNELVELKEYLRRNQNNELFKDSKILRDSQFNEREKNDMYEIEEIQRSDLKSSEKDNNNVKETKYDQNNYYQDSRTIRDIVNFDMHTRTTRIPRILTFEDILPNSHFRSNYQDTKKEYLDIDTLDTPNKRNYNPNFLFKVHLKDDEYSQWDDRNVKSQKNNNPSQDIKTNIKMNEPEKNNERFNKKKYVLVENNQDSFENTKIRKIRESNEADKEPSDKNSKNREKYDADRFKYANNQNVRHDDRNKNSAPEIRNNNFIENRNPSKQPFTIDSQSKESSSNFGRQSTKFISQENSDSDTKFHKTGKQSSGMKEGYDNSNKKYYRDNETSKKPIKSYWTQEHKEEKTSSENDDCSTGDKNYNHSKKKPSDAKESKHPDKKEDEFIRMSSEINAQYIKWNSEYEDSKKQSNEAIRTGFNKNHDTKFDQDENYGKKYDIEFDQNEKYHKNHYSELDHKDNYGNKYVTDFDKNNDYDKKRDIEFDQKENYDKKRYTDIEKKDNYGKKFDKEFEQKEIYDKKHYSKFDQQDNYVKKYDIEFDQRDNYDQKHGTEFDQKENYGKKYDIEFDQNDYEKHGAGYDKKGNYDKKYGIDFDHKKNYDENRDIGIDEKKYNDKRHDTEYDPKENYDKKLDEESDQKDIYDKNPDNFDKKLSERNRKKEIHDDDYVNKDASDFRKKSTYDYDNDSKKNKKENIEWDDEKPSKTKENWEDKKELNNDKKTKNVNNDNEDSKKDNLDKKPKKKPKINNDWDNKKENNNDWDKKTTKYHENRYTDDYKKPKIVNVWDSKIENNNDWDRITTKYHENRYNDDYKKKPTHKWDNENNGNFNNDWSKVGIPKKRPAWEESNSNIRNDKRKPEWSDNYSQRYRESHYDHRPERNPGRQGFGRTPIPYSGKKIIYDD